MRLLLLLLALLIVHPAQGQTVTEHVTSLGDADPVTRSRAACHLSRLRSSAEPAIPALIAVLGDGRQVEGNVCRGITSRNRWRWTRQLQTPGLLAAEALGNIGRPAVEPLIAALDSEDPIARENAVRALADLEDYRSVSPLIAMLSRESDDAVRAEVASALGSIEHKDAVPALIGTLGDDSALVREQTAWALGNIESPRAVEGLLQTLRDQDPVVRERAAWALGNIEDSRAVDGLMVLLEDDDVEVRKMAAWALSQMI